MEDISRGDDDITIGRWGYLGLHISTDGYNFLPFYSLLVYTYILCKSGVGGGDDLLSDPKYY